ncbi:hypothetical protein [Nostoc sp. DedQUE09]|uniref:hypothetical protein n=1 Tax=Nostoc sp. DedQUE09 TaxID=3075394 RepID=UPI002AD20E5D|nr:hypothetical protein [Nostoc sp. DedQUE09]MDZ7954249.1 hypothetical protein [Nostoc sp. DedQUE09]
MSQGFETKSADATKNSGGQRQPTQVADIGSIQQSLVEHFSDIKDPRVEGLQPDDENKPTWTRLLSNIVA